MLKIGDKVRVKKDLEKEFAGLNKSMVDLKGRIVTIVFIHGDGFFNIVEDRGAYFWTEEMIEKIEEKENNNMKELTFREVIANIKEGEVWESLHKTIEFKNNNFIVKSKIKKQNNYFVVNEYTTFKLKRPQYTFQEAFKAFEEGKEIESCESERGFKSKDNDSVYILMEHEICDRVYNGFRLFSHDEVKGKWYIND